MTLVHLPHSVLLANLAIGAFYAIGLRLSAANTDELEALLRQGVIDAMHGAHLTHKDLAFHMGIDQPTLCRQLSGAPHYHLSLTRMVRLPFVFWMHFGPALMAVVYRKRLQEFQQDARELVGKR